MEMLRDERRLEMRVFRPDDRADLIELSVAQATSLFTVVFWSKAKWKGVPRTPQP